MASRFPWQPIWGDPPARGAPTLLGEDGHRSGVGQGPDDAHTSKSKGAHVGLDRKRYFRTRHRAPGGRAPGPGPTPVPRTALPNNWSTLSFTACEPTGKLIESMSTKLN